MENGQWNTLREKHNKAAQAQIFALTMQLCGEMVLHIMYHIIYANDQIKSIWGSNSPKVLAIKHSFRIS